MLLLNNKLSKNLVNFARKSALALALLATLGVGCSVAASAGNSDDAIHATCRKEFRSAAVMKVENQKEYTKVTFNLNGVVMFAYYRENGNLMAVVRNIPSTQLPIQLQMDLRQRNGGAWITDLFELNADGQTVYYVTLENSDSIVTLRADSANGWSTYRKLTKLSE